MSWCPFRTVRWLSWMTVLKWVDRAGWRRIAVRWMGDAFSPPAGGPRLSLSLWKSCSHLTQGRSIFIHLISSFAVTMLASHVISWAPFLLFQFFLVAKYDYSIFRTIVSICIWPPPLAMENRRIKPLSGRIVKLVADVATNSTCLFPLPGPSGLLRTSL